VSPVNQQLLVAIIVCIAGIFVVAHLGEKAIPGLKLKKPLIKGTKWLVGRIWRGIWSIPYYLFKGIGMLKFGKPGFQKGWNSFWEKGLAGLFAGLRDLVKK